MKLGQNLKFLIKRNKYILLCCILVFLFQCKQESKDNLELDLLESCITTKFNNNTDIFSCVDGKNFDLYGYMLVDTMFYRTNFKGENIKIDSVPINVINAYKAKSNPKVCNPVCLNEYNPKVKMESRFWLIKDIDTIYTICTIYNSH